MQVAKASNGSVTLVLETQAEIDGLWAMAGHIGGSDSSLRNLFSSPSKGGSLFTMLLPHVSAVPLQPKADQSVVNPPHAIREVLHHHYRQSVRGALYFQPSIHPTQQHSETAL